MSLTIQCTEPASSQLLGTCGQAGATEAVEESAIGAAVLPTTEDEALAPGIVHCGICYEDHAVTDSVQLPCGHSFCWQRIAHWARNPTSHQPSCPVCRHLLIYQKCHHRPPGMFYHAGRRIPRHEFDGRCPPCRGVSWQLERHICTPEDMRVGWRAFRRDATLAPPLPLHSSLLLSARSYSRSLPPPPPSASSPTPGPTGSSSRRGAAATPAAALAATGVPFHVRPPPPTPTSAQLPAPRRQPGQREGHEGGQAAVTPRRGFLLSRHPVPPLPGDSSGQARPLPPVREEEEEGGEESRGDDTAARPGRGGLRRRRAVRRARTTRTLPFRRRIPTPAPAPTTATAPAPPGGHGGWREMLADALQALAMGATVLLVLSSGFAWGSRRGC